MRIDQMPPEFLTSMFTERSAQPELLDRMSHDVQDLRRTLRHMDGANRWLGGYRAVTSHLAPYLESGSTRLLDVGTGSADVPRRLVRWGARAGHPINVIAIDAQLQIARAARRRGAPGDGVHIGVGDGLRLPLADDSVDVAISTLTLHHLDDDDAVRLVTELRRVSNRVVIVNDLERHAVNYWGARAIAATAWRQSPYAQDGPISVLRAFRPAELRAIGDAAGLKRASVHRHFPFRLALVGEP